MTIVIHSTAILIKLLCPIFWYLTKPCKADEQTTVGISLDALLPFISVFALFSLENTWWIYFWLKPHQAAHNRSQAQEQHRDTGQFSKLKHPVQTLECTQGRSKLHRNDQFNKFWASQQATHSVSAILTVGFEAMWTELNSSRDAMSQSCHQWNLRVYLVRC